MDDSEHPPDLTSKTSDFNPAKHQLYCSNVSFRTFKAWLHKVRIKMKATARGPVEPGTNYRQSKQSKSTIEADRPKLH